VLVFGAPNGAKVNGGVRFDPATGHWRSIPTEGAPESGTAAGTAWDGRRLAVLADSSGSAGAVYDTQTDRWTELPTAGKPSPRRNAAVLWDRERLIVFGGWRTGSGGSAIARDGAVCDLAAGTWTPIADPRPENPYEAAF